MIEHIVLFKWQETATPEQLEQALNALRGLKETVPNILDLTCGENFSERAQGYTHGLVVRFPDRDALEVYVPHPAHQEVVQTYIRPIVAEVLAMDYTF